MRIKTLLSSITISSFLVLALTGAVSAANIGDAGGSLEQAGRGAFGAGVTSGTNTLESIVGQILKTFISILGVLFLVLTVYAGYLWMNARGNEQQVSKAKDILTQSVIGFIVVLAAYMITDFIVNGILRATGN